MKIIITLIGLITFLSEAGSQSIERKLVSAAGTSYARNNYQLSFSIGEVVITPSPAIKVSGTDRSILAITINRK